MHTSYCGDRYLAITTTRTGPLIAGVGNFSQFSALPDNRVVLMGAAAAAGAAAGAHKHSSALRPKRSLYTRPACGQFSCPPLLFNFFLFLSSSLRQFTRIEIDIHW